MRCSGGCGPASTCARTAVERQRPACVVRRAGAAAPSKRRLDRRLARAAAGPVRTAAPRHGAGSAAVASLTTISPAPRPPLLERRRRGGPVTSSSRCERPTRKSGRRRCARRPTCAAARRRRPSRCGPISRRSVAASRIAERQPRGVAVALEQQQQRVAAELQQAAAVLVGDLQQRAKHVPIASASCSAPSRPTRASRSDSVVKPETSTSDDGPSSVRTTRGGRSACRSSTRGT